MVKSLAKCYEYYEMNKYLYLKSTLKSIISEFTNDNILKLCSWHPFGFLKVNLGGIMVNKIDYNLQLNIWLPDFRSEQKNPSICHDHNGDLQSYILNGTLLNMNYRVLGQKDEGHSLYKVVYESNKSISKLIKANINCEVSEMNIYNAGDKYKILQGEFHNTYVPIGLFTSTFVVRNYFKGRETYNIRQNTIQDEFLFDRNPNNNKFYLSKALKLFIDT